MQYLRARYYDPSVGRFFSKDKWGSLLFYPASLNKWIYASGNPINYSDPRGLFLCPANMTKFDCDYTDWTAWLFGGFYQRNGIDSKQRINIGKGDQNVAGAITYDYLQIVGPLGPTYHDIADIGMGILGPGYEIGRAITGTNLLGESLSNEERLEFAFWSIIGLGDCLPVIRFSPEFRLSGSSELLSGQKHHVLTNKIMKALNDHPTLSGKLLRENYLVIAKELIDHIGYQKWHIAYDNEVVKWLTTHRSASKDEFINYLREIYQRPEIREIFPTALEIIKKTE